MVVEISTKIKRIWITVSTNYYWGKWRYLGSTESTFLPFVTRGFPTVGEKECLKRCYTGFSVWHCSNQMFTHKKNEFSKNFCCIIISYLVVQIQAGYKINISTVITRKFDILLVVTKYVYRQSELTCIILSYRENGVLCEGLV